MRNPFFLAVASLSACFLAPVDHPLGTPDAGDPNVRCGYSSGFENEGLVCVSIAPIICGGQRCAEGQVCCITEGRCATPGDCQVLPASTRFDPNPRACGSSADCAEGEYCMLDQLVPSTPRPVRRCIGAGHCQPLDNCGWCGGGAGRCTVCGCDGKTYESMQQACVAGVSVPWDSKGPCGVSQGYDGGAFTYQCGNDAQCPAGAQCCHLTGRCFDLSEPWRCAERPDGTIFNCLDSSECVPTGAGGGNGQDRYPYCAGQGCGTPGLCTFPPSPGDCSGESNAVCGCDGRTYVNECWARVASVRVAASGPCP